MTEKIIKEIKEKYISNKRTPFTKEDEGFLEDAALREKKEEVTNIYSSLFKLTYPFIGGPKLDLEDESVLSIEFIEDTFSVAININHFVQIWLRVRKLSGVEFEDFALISISHEFTHYIQLLTNQEIHMSNAEHEDTADFVGGVLARTFLGDIDVERFSKLRHSVFLLGEKHGIFHTDPNVRKKFSDLTSKNRLNEGQNTQAKRARLFELGFKSKISLTEVIQLKFASVIQEIRNSGINE